MLDEIRSHARAAAAVPEECCGLVLGAGTERFRRVYRCRNVMDRMHQEDPAQFPRTNRDAFYIDPGELMRAQVEADAMGEVVTAIYHSHVDARAYFSEMDQTFATQAFPEADHLVVSVLVVSVPGSRIEETRIKEEGLFRRNGAADLLGFRVQSIPT